MCDCVLVPCVCVPAPSGTGNVAVQYSIGNRSQHDAGVHLQRHSMRSTLGDALFAAKLAGSTSTVAGKSSQGPSSGRPALRLRGRQCAHRYDQMLERRWGVKGHVELLEAAVTAESTSPATQLNAHPAGQSLAVLLRGQAFRGSSRETFSVDSRLETRLEAQRRCLISLQQHLLEPFERSGHRVDVFLTVYRRLGGPMEELLNPLGTRVVSVTTVQQASTPSQLLPLGVAVRAFLAWCAEHGAGYAAVVVTRFDLYLKVDMHRLLGDASSIDGFRFLFRESGGHWRHHSQREATNRTFEISMRSDWRRNLRVPDAMLAFPFAYTRCFLGAVRNELFPVRNESRPLGFLHNMIYGLHRALPANEGQPPRWSYLVNSQFDSNPCRSTCMLNPIYDLLPRMVWVTESNICQRTEDFLFDPMSQSLCCPSPNYCCPNSVSSCRDPGAIFFSVVKAGVSAETIVRHWPLKQGRPYSWELTPRSREVVRDAWLTAAAALQDGGTPAKRSWMLQERAKFRAAAAEVMTSSTFQRHGE